MGVCLVGIVQIRQQRKNGPTPTANGNGGNGGNGRNGGNGSNQGNGNSKYATTEYVDLRIDARLGQHEIHCGNVDMIVNRLDRMENKLDKLLGGRGG